MKQTIIEEIMNTTKRIHEVKKMPEDEMLEYADLLDTIIEIRIALVRKLIAKYSRGDKYKNKLKHMTTLFIFSKLMT